MEVSTIKSPVKHEHIKCFDKLYHQFLKLNLEAAEKYPEEIKQFASLDIAVINIIDTNPDIIVREIADILKIPNSTLTSVINRLEDKEIANRYISKRDRRSYGVKLTEKGQKVQKAHLDFEKAYFEDILNRLETNEDRENFLHLLGKIINRT